ncbi:MAG: alkaline phosphatase family protein [Candidatus Krumholzibacteriota bacterium]|nr:alkaline phosphatase family protein [Candidatus Krumholzibacteriota bacterium]
MRDLVVVLLIDALGWEVARRFDFAAGILPRRAPLGTVLGYSSAAIPSLLSGASPVEHGSWAMFRRAAGRSSFGAYRWLPPLPRALEWRARRWIRRMSDRAGHIRNYYDLYEIPVRLLPRFDVAQYGDPYLPGGLKRETLFDRFVSEDIRYDLWYHRTSESHNMAALVDAIPGTSDVLFLYTAELDAIMHRVGIFHENVEERLLRYERFLERVIGRAEQHGRRARVFMLSDHGMADVRSEVDLWGELEKRGHRLGRDYLAFFDSTMARLWADEKVARDAEEILAASESGRLLDDDELARHGCLFADRSYGEWILLANPGVMIVPSFMGRARIAGMHGYDPDDRYSIGCFATNDESGDLPGSILDFKEYLLSRIKECP